VNCNGFTNKNPWLIFIVTAVGIGMSSLDAGIINVALPTISSQFQTNLSLAQWTVSGYLLVICILLPMCGKLSDIYTRRKMYLFGLLIFFLGSILCSLSFSILTLIVFRIIQGFGAAMIMANNQAIIVTTFPDNKRGLALGLNSTMVSVGLLAGPAIGGLLVSGYGWRSIFYLNVPLGIFACVAGYILLPADKINKSEKFDLLNALFFAIGGTSLFLVLNNSNIWGWTSIESIICLIMAVFFIRIFLKRESISQNPVIHFSLFSIKSFFYGNILSFIAYFAVSASSILLPFYLERQMNLSPDKVGFILFLVPLLMIVISPISGFISDFIESNYLISSGLGFIAGGLLFQVYLSSNSQLIQVIIGQVLIGIGYALFQAPNNSSILCNVPKEKIGITGSLSSLMRNAGKIFGTSISIAIFELVQNYITLDNSDDPFMYGFKAASIVSTTLVVVGIYISHYKNHDVMANVNEAILNDKLTTTEISR